jgi:hypothetical protein
VVGFSKKRFICPQRNFHFRFGMFEGTKGIGPTPGHPDGLLENAVAMLQFAGMLARPSGLSSGTHLSETARDFPSFVGGTEGLCYALICIVAGLLAVVVFVIPLFRIEKKGCLLRPISTIIHKLSSLREQKSRFGREVISP